MGLGGEVTDCRRSRVPSNNTQRTNTLNNTEVRTQRDNKMEESIRLLTSIGDQYTKCVVNIRSSSSSSSLDAQ